MQSKYGDAGHFQSLRSERQNRLCASRFDANNFSGHTIRTAGDINDYGIVDLIYGASGSDPDGDSLYTSPPFQLWHF